MGHGGSRPGLTPLAWLPEPLRGPVEAAWRATLAGEEARLPPSPPPWCDVLPACLETLRPWVDGRPAGSSGHDGVVRALDRQVHRAWAFLARDPAHPDRSELALLLAAWSADEPGSADRALDALCADRELALTFLSLREGVRAGGAAAVARSEVLRRYGVVAERRARAHEVTVLRAALGRLEVELQRRRRAADRIGRALGPGASLVASGADWTAGYWADGDWDGLERLAESAGQDRGLRELAALLGVVADELGPPEERIQAPSSPAVQSAGHEGAEETAGVERSAAVGRALASELGLLAHPELEPLFWARVASRELLTWRLAGNEALPPARSVASVTAGAQGRRGGPLVVCLDTSGSMAGEGERLAKALVVALARLTRERGRPSRVLAFGGPGELVSLELAAADASLPGLLGLLAGGFHGGTEVGGAVVEALRACREELGGGDVVLVTDGLFVSPEGLGQDLADAKARGTALHLVLVGAGAEPRDDRGASLGASWRLRLDGHGLATLARRLAG